MSKNFLRGIFIMPLIMAVYGCGTTKGVQVRSYIEDRSRVDQEVEGTLGNWENAPTIQEEEERKKTRKIYVLEFSKEAEPEAQIDIPENETKAVESRITSSSEAPSREEGMSPQPSEPEITIPSFDFDEPAPVQEQQPITPLGSSGEYTVEKDDTLQKISKKFYGTYSQWSKIYEANKERIENPDSIQPGIVIVIPPVE